MKIVPSTVNCLKRKGDKKANSLLAEWNKCKWNGQY